MPSEANNHELIKSNDNLSILVQEFREAVICHKIITQTLNGVRQKRIVFVFIFKSTVLKSLDQTTSNTSAWKSCEL